MTQEARRFENSPVLYVESNEQIEQIRKMEIGS